MAVKKSENPRLVFPAKAKQAIDLPKRVIEQRDQMLMFDVKHKQTRPPKVGTQCLREFGKDEIFNSEWHLERYFKKGLYNKDWYSHTYATIRELFGSDKRANLFILLLASTSPMASVTGNLMIALKALKMYDDGASEYLFKKEFLRTHRLNIYRVFKGEPIHGPKVSAFAKNLYGDRDAVTVDRWMLRAYTGTFADPTQDEEDEEDGKSSKGGKDRISLSMYRCIAEDVRRRAHAEKGLVYPSEYQAALWTGIKLLEGTEANTTEPFDVLLRASLQEGQMKMAFEENDPDIQGSFAAFEAALGPAPTEAEYPEEEMREMGENPPADDTIFVYDPSMVALK